LSEVFTQFDEQQTLGEISEEWMLRLLSFPVMDEVSLVDGFLGRNIT